MPNEAAKMLTPEGLANQLFDGALAHNATDPRGAARQVITFLNDALLYAVFSAKEDPIVYLTEALVYLISATSGDEAARKELLKHVGETIANAPLLPGGKPPASVAGKP